MNVIVMNVIVTLIMIVMSVIVIRIMIAIRIRTVIDCYCNYDLIVLI